MTNVIPLVFSSFIYRGLYNVDVTCISSLCGISSLCMIYYKKNLSPAIRSDNCYSLEEFEFSCARAVFKLSYYLTHCSLDTPKRLIDK